MSTTAPAPHDTEHEDVATAPDLTRTGPARTRWRAATARARALFDEAWQRARRRRGAIAAVLATLALGLAAAIAVGVNQPPPPVATAADDPVVVDTRPVPPLPPGGNGVLAATGISAGSRTSDIYLVDPSTPVPRQLTATPQSDEYAPSWSPDGTQLAFVRSDLAPGTGNAGSCREVCDLVVVDPGIGTETLSVDLTAVAPAPLGSSMVPTSIAWAPDGSALVVALSSCGIGGCGGNGTAGSVVVDVSAGRALATPPGFDVHGWSPDGRWLSLLDSHAFDSLDWQAPAIYLVPAGHLDAETFTDPSKREDWVVLSAATEYGVEMSWSPDASSILLGEGIGVGTPAAISLVDLAGQGRHTIVADGAGAVASPDGQRIAYVTGYDVNAPDGEILTDVWVARVDGTDARRVARHADLTGWSPDGQHLIAQDDGTWFTIDVDGTNRTDLAVLTAEGHLPWGHGSASWQRLPTT